MRKQGTLRTNFDSLPGATGDAMRAMIYDDIVVTNVCVCEGGGKLKPCVEHKTTV